MMPGGERTVNMEIIKEGKWTKERFECKRCATVFVADRDEYSAERREKGGRSDWVCTAKCPVCGDSVDNREWLY